jgi:hypothetical protein
MLKDGPNLGTHDLTNRIIVLDHVPEDKHDAAVYRFVHCSCQLPHHQEKPANVLPLAKPKGKLASPRENDKDTAYR